jgi:hypothetical protein
MARVSKGGVHFAARAEQKATRRMHGPYRDLLNPAAGQ